MSTSTLGDKLRCPHCLEEIDYLENPKQLPCNHIYCSPCLETLTETVQTGVIITCSICSKKHHQHDSSAFPTPEGCSKKESKIDQSAEESAAACDRCKNKKKTAVCYCVNCERKLCPLHEERHQDYFSDEEHKVISIQAYQKTPTLYQKATCEKHGRELGMCCQNCYCLKCPECDVETKCASEFEEHNFQTLKGIALLMREEFDVLLKKCSERITEMCKLEKETWRRLDELEEECMKLRKQVERKTEELNDVAKDIVERACWTTKSHLVDDLVNIIVNNDEYSVLIKPGRSNDPNEHVYGQIQTEFRQLHPDNRFTTGRLRAKFKSCTRKVSNILQTQKTATGINREKLEIGATAWFDTLVPLMAQRVQNQQGHSVEPGVVLTPKQRDRHGEEEEGEEEEGALAGRARGGAAMALAGGARGQDMPAKTNRKRRAEPDGEGYFQQWLKEQSVFQNNMLNLLTRFVDRTAQPQQQEPQQQPPQQIQPQQQPPQQIQPQQQPPQQIQPQQQPPQQIPPQQQTPQQIPPQHQPPQQIQPQQQPQQPLPHPSSFHDETQRAAPQTCQQTPNTSHPPVYHWQPHFSQQQQYPSTHLTTYQQNYQPQYHPLQTFKQPESTPHSFEQ